MAAASATSTSAAAGSATATASASATAVAERKPPIIVETEGPFALVDLHVDTPWKVHFKDRPLSLPKGHATPEMMRRGHVAALVYPIYIPDYANDHNPRVQNADEIYDTIDKIIAANELLEAGMAPGLKPRAVPADRVAIFVSIEGAGAFAEDISQIDRFIERGVRMISLSHAADTKLSGSATGKKAGGLTDIGKQFCKRIYEAGALVDVSHLSTTAFADLLPIAKEHGAPIVASHSNARALRKHRRNLTDEQLRQIAASGGVAGLNLYHRFIRGGKPRMEHVVAMVKHMVEVAGIDHVAIGSDYDGGTPVGALKDVGEIQALAKALVDAGFDDADVRKIFALNALRVLYWGTER